MLELLIDAINTQTLTMVFAAIAAVATVLTLAMPLLSGDALGNLSRVLRDRKKMKAKIQAMSQEAKASAGIIGALPLAVMTLVYITSPQYISLLWTEPLGRLMLAGSALWMFMGVMVMKKMINFDF